MTLDRGSGDSSCRSRPGQGGWRASCWDDKAHRGPGLVLATGQQLVQPALVRGRAVADTGLQMPVAPGEELPLLGMTGHQRAGPAQEEHFHFWWPHREGLGQPDPILLEDRCLALSRLTAGRTRCLRSLPSSAQLPGVDGSPARTRG